MTRFLYSLGTAAFIFSVLGIGLFLLERQIFVTYIGVLPQNRIRPEVWQQNFEQVALYTFVLAFLFTIGWETFSYFRYQVKQWQRVSTRIPWFVAGFSMVIATAIYTWYSLFPTQNNAYGIACLVFPLNGVLLHWLATVIQSPSSVRYVPLGSLKLRTLFVRN